MAQSKVTIQVVGPYMFIDDHTVILSERLIRLFHIPVERFVTLRWGSLRHSVRIVPFRGRDTLRISSGLQERLGIPNGTPLRLRYRHAQNELQMGPLIGILVNRANSGGDGMFGSNTAYCRELAVACRAEGAFLYVFTPSDLDGNRQSLSGYYARNGWARAEFPLPNVVLNRLTMRRLENKPSVQHFMKEVKSQHGASLFNEKYLNKSEVFEALKPDASMRGLLPESHLFNGPALLKAMCGKYASVFLKPVRGSLGKGIMRIARSGEGYTLEQANVNGVGKAAYASLPELYAAISGKVRSQPHQIQQGLDLIRVAGHPVDFRAMVQKNYSGKWAVTSVVARIAGSNHFVSNLARGGTLSGVMPTLAKSNVAPAARARIPAKLRKAALLIAQGVETNIPYHFGELGIDLAVDRQGRIWLLEVNSKPSRTDDSALTDGGKVRPSVKQIVQYARHLAGM